MTAVVVLVVGVSAVGLAFKRRRSRKVLAREAGRVVIAANLAATRQRRR